MANGYKNRLLSLFFSNKIQYLYGTVKRAKFEILDRATPDKIKLEPVKFCNYSQMLCTVCRYRRILNVETRLFSIQRINTNKAYNDCCKVFAY